MALQKKTTVWKSVFSGRGADNGGVRGTTGTARFLRFTCGGFSD